MKTNWEKVKNILRLGPDLGQRSWSTTLSVKLTISEAELLRQKNANQLLELVKAKLQVVKASILNRLDDTEDKLKKALGES
jgi:hypothetical protein